MRGLLTAKGIGHRGGHRFSRTVSRVENLSDAAFGFLIAMILGSEPFPKRFDELQAISGQIVAVLLSIILLMRLWYAHYTYFRRYDLEDEVTVWLNGVLIFTIVIAMYPMRLMVKWGVGVFTGAEQATRNAQGKLDYATVRHEQIPQLVTYAMVSYAAVAILFAALYFNAWRHRNPLDLTRYEQFEALRSVVRFLCIAASGFVILVAFDRLFVDHSGDRFFVTMLLNTLLVVPSRLMRRRSRQLAKEAEAELSSS